MDGYLHVSSRQDAGLLAETTRMQSSSQPFMRLDLVLFLCVLCVPEGHLEHELQEPGSYSCGTVSPVVSLTFHVIGTPSPCS